MAVNNEDEELNDLSDLSNDDDDDDDDLVECPFCSNTIHLPLPSRLLSKLNLNIQDQNSLESIFKQFSSHEEKSEFCFLYYSECVVVPEFLRKLSDSN